MAISLILYLTSVIRNACPSRLLNQLFHHSKAQNYRTFGELQVIELNQRQLTGPSEDLEGLKAAIDPLLKVALLLRSIRYFGSYNARIPLISMLPSITYQNLRKVDLFEISCSMRKMVRFLARHAGTLEEVNIVMFLDDGTWFSALEQLRETVFIKLRSSMLNAWAEGFEGEVEAHHYLLHKTDVNPLKDDPGA